MRAGTLATAAGLFGLRACSHVESDNFAQVNKVYYQRSAVVSPDYGESGVRINEIGWPSMRRLAALKGEAPGEGY